MYFYLFKGMQPGNWNQGLMQILFPLANVPLMMNHKVTIHPLHHLSVIAIGGAKKMSAMRRTLHRLRVYKLSMHHPVDHRLQIRSVFQYFHLYGTTKTSKNVVEESLHLDVGRKYLKPFQIHLDQLVFLVGTRPLQHEVFRMITLLIVL